MYSVCRQVKGCPLKVAVTAVADAGRVVCSGDGLRVGTVGKEIRSFIDTRRAGPGILIQSTISGLCCMSCNHLTVSVFEDEDIRAV